MRHFASPSFWELYQKLPAEISALADKNFSLLKENQNHPSLKLKKVILFWSVRVGRKHRALAIELEDGFLWFWIGTHAD